MGKSKTYGKHLTLENREFIESSLAENHTIKEIAKFIFKDPTTISKEIKRNRIFKESSTFGGFSNTCKNRYACSQTSVCGNTKCHLECRQCSKCSTYCNLFENEICPYLKRAPHVCNGCYKKTSCKLEKYYYRSKDAQKKYEELLKSSREGINLSEDELKELDNLTTPLIKKGQPVSHIFAKHSTEIPCSNRTFYHYVEKGILSLANIDLRRKVRYKKRKSSKTTIRRNSKILIGRKYSDFLSFISENPDTKIVEMDTVEGIKGGKVFLTLLFRGMNLMLIFLLPDKTQNSVIKVFNDIEKSIGTELFQQTFPLILTDNGSEFLNPTALENSILSDKKRTILFYCDPNCSHQKASIEKNHEYIRYVLPKGKSFNNLTPKNISLLMNHINSTARENLNGRAPMEIAKLLLPKEVVKALKLKLIPADDVCLTSKLFVQV